MSSTGLGKCQIYFGLHCYNELNSETSTPLILFKGCKLLKYSTVVISSVATG